jgi:hypothetical protein
VNALEIEVSQTFCVGWNTRKQAVYMDSRARSVSLLKN